MRNQILNDIKQIFERGHFTEAQVKTKQVKCVQPKSQMVKNHKLSSHAMLAKKY